MVPGLGLVESVTGRLCTRWKWPPSSSADSEDPECTSDSSDSDDDLVL